MTVMTAIPSRLRRIATALLIIGVLGLLTLCWVQRNVYRVSMGRGEVTYLVVEVPMQRFGRPKSFAKERNLPVRCTVTARNGRAHGVKVSVVQTGHKVHKLWAKLRIEASETASPGRHERPLAFTIDDQGGWPEATVVVSVQDS